MTGFKERMFSDFKAMLEKEPREMPASFAPELTIADGRVMGRACGRFQSGNAEIRLGFVLMEDPAKNGVAMNALRQSLWQALELARLGRSDELRAQGIIT